MNTAAEIFLVVEVDIEQSLLSKSERERERERESCQIGHTLGKWADQNFFHSCSHTTLNRCEYLHHHHHHQQQPNHIQVDMKFSWCLLLGLNDRFSSLLRLRDQLLWTFTRALTPHPEDDLPNGTSDLPDLHVPCPSATFDWNLSTDV